MSDSAERWFDSEDSEVYLGLGHQDKVDFAAWATEQELAVDPRRDVIDPQSVKHIWAKWTDAEPHHLLVLCCELDTGAFPITEVQP